MHESEKWKWSCSVVSDSSRPHGLQPTRLLRPWDFPGESAGVGAIAFSTSGSLLATYSICSSVYLSVSVPIYPSLPSLPVDSKTDFYICDSIL